ncbi:MAG: Ig-like domain-containing protein, partial [Bifidobacteriaceae bacterium]|nr:Ig-like domain-containing protein [Bifidobacteriaceae bacterium]
MVEAGQARYYPALPAGAYDVEARFTPSPDANLEGSWWSGQYTVGKADTDTQVGLESANTAVAGEPLTVTARVAVPDTGPDALGSVQFSLDSSAIGDLATLRDGQATLTLTPTGGNHRIAASYGGDGSYRGSDSAVKQVSVERAASTSQLTVSDATGSTGNDVVVDVVVAPPPGNALVPGGNVAVYDNTGGNVVAGPLTLDAQGAARAFLRFVKGTHRLFAVYEGDSNFLASSSAASLSDIEGQTTKVSVASLGSPSLKGEAARFRASVAIANGPAAGTAVASGLVQFAVDGEPEGTAVAVVGGQATVDVVLAATGQYQVSAQYLGDLVYEPAASALAAQIVVAPEVSVGLTVSPQSPGVIGEDVRVTATVEPSALGVAPLTGVVQFLVDGVGLGGVVSVSGATASTAVQGLSAGSHTIQARYTGDSHHDAANSGLLTYVVVSPGAAGVSVG